MVWLVQLRREWGPVQGIGSWLRVLRCIIINIKNNKWLPWKSMFFNFIFKIVFANFKSGYHCFSTKDGVWRVKSGDWLAGSQANVSEFVGMLTCRLLLQRVSTVKIWLILSDNYKADWSKVLFLKCMITAMVVKPTGNQSI